ncbi:MAG: TraR/DksA C4-type zinc finger protein [Gammaproteobacteria bacterium]|nr:TraR/DksA C4-type zinc finger protein [Gammaproteobacteria bacterium]MDJ0871078.1 TraR/DksA C4-type zinc finger protein [Gammaproteobacteria bacterium]
MGEREELDLSGLRTRLLEQREELLRQSVDHADELKPVELDQARLGRLSRMDAMQSQALSAELQRRREMDLRRIDEALQRMDDGEYGYCVTCGEPINPKRLEIEPMTKQCVRCASEAER